MNSRGWTRVRRSSTLFPEKKKKKVDSTEQVEKSTTSLRGALSQRSVGEEVQLSCRPAHRRGWIVT